MAVVREDAKLLAVCKKCEFFTITEHDFIQMITARDLKISNLSKQIEDLKEVCSRLEDEKEIILKHIPRHLLDDVVEELVNHSEAFTGAEYFAGR
jgi:hypothetical protein